MNRSDHLHIDDKFIDKKEQFVVHGKNQSRSSSQSLFILDILTVLFPVSIILTTATQFRLDNYPIGPGEVLLASSLVFLLFYIMNDIGCVKITKPSYVFIVFWSITVFALILGSINGIFLNLMDKSNALHDILAIGLSAVVSILFSHLFFSFKKLNHVVKILSISIIVILFILYIAGIQFTFLGPLRLWWGSRFTSWSINPNQSALLALTAPFLLLHQMEIVKKKSVVKYKIFFVFLLAAGLVSGWSTLSGALRVAWSISFFVLMAIIAGQCIKNRKEYYSLFLVLIGGAILAVGIVFGVNGIKYGFPEKETKSHSEGKRDNKVKLTASFKKVYLDNPNKSNDIHIRLALIKNGFIALHKSSHVGFGPGAYSGIEEPFEQSEAHNTWLDWTISTGILGGIALLGLVGWVAYRLLQAKYYSLFAGLIALIIFSMFHYVLRHPLVWFYLVLAAKIACARIEEDVERVKKTKNRVVSPIF